MVRLLVLYNKPRDPAAFERYYREVHIPLAKKMPELKRCTISRHVAPVGGGDAYYLVAELDWDDLGAFGRAMQSPQGQATAQDVPKFATGGVTMQTYEVEEI